MAKSPKSRHIDARAQVISPPGENESDAIDVKESHENWSTFSLADGTVVRIKPVLLDVARVKGQYNEEGDPVYALRTSMIVDAKVPSKLKKKS